MKNLFKKLILSCIVMSLCFVVSACDMGLQNQNQEKVVYTSFEDKLYFKGELYSLYPSFNNTTFYFPILSNEKIDLIENVIFYNGESEIDGTITVIPDTRDDKIINNDLYLNVIEFQLNILNIEGIKVTKISLIADNMQISYNVYIAFHYYYLNPEYNLTTQGDMLLEYNDKDFTLIYGYASSTVVSRLNHLESFLDGIEINQLFIADGNNKSDVEGELPWIFNEISNNDTNMFAYKNNVLKIKCNYLQIKQEAVFFKDAFRANLTIGEDKIDIMLPDIASNSLIEVYVALCKELNI